MLSGTCKDESNLDQQKKAFEHVRQKERDESCSGVLRSFLCCANYAMLYKAAVEMHEEHKKQSGAAVYLRELAERSSDADSPRTETWLSDFGELAKKCYSALSASGYNRKDTSGFKPNSMPSLWTMCNIDSEAAPPLLESSLANDSVSPQRIDSWRQAQRSTVWMAMGTFFNSFM